MIRIGEKGLTLVELLIATAIMGMIAGAAMASTSTSLKVHAYGNARSQLYKEGLLIMERMTNHVNILTGMA